MTLKSLSLTVFLVGVMGAFAGPGPMADMFPAPDFLNGLNSTAVGAFKNITMDPSLSMNEKNSQMESWASQQSSDVQNAFNAWHQNLTSHLTDMIAQDDATASTLSPDAQTLYNETKAIAINNDLTSDQICSQLKTLYANASQTVTSELAQAFPQYAHIDMCKGHKKHSNPRQKRQMYQNYRYDSPEYNSPEHNSRESWERYGNRYQNGANLQNQGQYYYGNGQQQQQQRYGRQAYRWDSPEDRYDDSHEWNRNGYGNQGGYRTQGGYGNQGAYGTQGGYGNQGYYGYGK